MRRLRQRGKHIGLLVEPAPLLPGVREHLAQRLPEPQRAVADGQHRGAHPAAAAVPQQIRPRLGRLPVPVGQRDELLAAVGADPDHHQQAQLLLLQPHLEVDAVDPQVDVVGTRQIPVLECLGLVLPLRGQPGDRRRRQPGARAQELLQRRHRSPGWTARAGTAAAAPRPSAATCAPTPAGSPRRTAAAHRYRGRHAVVDPRRAHR